MIFLCYFGNSMYFCNVFDRHTKIMQHQLNFQIMTQKEFFDRTSIELTEDQYKQVEQMYLEAGNMDKDEFCKDYKKHHESTLLATYFRQAENLKNKLDNMRDERSSLVDFLLERAQCFGDIELLNKAIELVGHDKVIKRKIRLGMPLWDEDKEYIVENIK